MQAMRVLVIFALLAAVLHAPVSAARAREDTRTMRLTSLEAAVVREINHVRTARGLRPLLQVPGLGGAARSHTKAMLDFGFFGHQSVDGKAVKARIERFYPSRGWQSWSVGEVLLASPDRKTDAAAVVAAWLDSPPHREVLLSPAWRDVGVGAIYAPTAPRAFADAEVVAVTVDFGRRTGR